MLLAEAVGLHGTEVLDSHTAAQGLILGIHENFILIFLRFIDATG